jgi:hypothetical protein
MFDQLRKELEEAGYTGINPDSLQDIYNDKVKLTHTAHVEFAEFMLQGQRMFADK